MLTLQSFTHFSESLQKSERLEKIDKPNGVRLLAWKLANFSLPPLLPIMPSTFSLTCPIGVLTLGTVAWLLSAFTPSTAGETLLLQPGMLHLRNVSQVEWSTFPQKTDGEQISMVFQATPNPERGTLTLRQQDVKETWDVKLNGISLGRLVRDENDLRCDFDVPVDTLRAGENRLEIICKSKTQSDDIRVGDIELHSMDRTALRHGSTLQVAIVDVDNRPLPGRITIINHEGTLIPVGAPSTNDLAVREGVVYTATGNASIGLRPGKYRILAGRGFEYSLASTSVDLKEGENAKRTLQLDRQVDTTGWVACDTHVHTVTHSGHGDCTIEERMVTLAGEGIELPIATDHNKQIDYRPIAESVGVASHFTPVIGNEVTTKHGHFNIFPATPDAETPDPKELDWAALFDDIYATPNVRVAILNHARDLHADFRPFSPRHHVSLSGENLDGWKQDFNAMELINSGAVQTDCHELFLDWCGLINRGLNVTPVGCSDSHDVSRYIVGQGRTYIRTEDSVPGAINLQNAVESFRRGNVIVSYGLLLKLAVETDGENRMEKAGPGDLLTMPTDSQHIQVTAELLGPHWVRPRTIQLFVNGAPRDKISITEKKQEESPLQIKRSWTLPRSALQHDTWITAVAIGEGVQAPHWPTAKPYQPDSPAFTPATFSSTGPIRIDVDGDGQYFSPRQYAQQLITSHRDASSGSTPDLRLLSKSLRSYDSSVVHQTMSLLLGQGMEPDPAFRSAFDGRAADYLRQWQQSMRARVEGKE